MSHITNRTFIGSIVFLDIVEYSQQPVDEQIRLKNRFNVILAEAIKDVAVNDRIILDTGDGAAISFLGDPEDALFVGLNIRDAIIAEEGSSTPPLSIRMGINLGPVKLVQGIDGRRNLLGDGINVAQRVMSFATPGQVLVSSSYFEVISRLSQEYARLFHYEGSRADKNIREHQVYSVCPVDKENIPLPTSAMQRKEEQGGKITGGNVSVSAVVLDMGGQSGKTVMAEEGETLQAASQTSAWRLGWDKMSGNWSVMWLGWKKRLISWTAKWFNRDAIRNRRTMFTIAAALIVLLISVPVIMWKMGGTPVRDAGTLLPPTSVATPEVAQKSKTPAKAREAETPATAKKTKIPEKSKKVETHAEAKKAEGSAQTSEDQKKNEAASTSEKTAAPAKVSLGVAPWGEVYVDGNKKGVSPPLNSLQLTPGRHQIEIRNTTFPPYTQDLDLKPGEQLKIKHKFR